MLKAMNNKNILGSVPDIMTLDEVADALRVRRFRAWRFVKDGDLPSFRVGAGYRVTRRDLEIFVRAGGKKCMT